MAASRSDQYYLSNDTMFINRVRQSLVAACNAIKNENNSGPGVTYHRERETYGAAVMNQPDAFKGVFAIGVATDANVISDATVNGTVVLTAGNAAAQAALVTDAHIDAAISGQFNTFFRTPAS